MIEIYFNIKANCPLNYFIPIEYAVSTDTLVLIAIKLKLNNSCTLINIKIRCIGQKEGCFFDSFFVCLILCLILCFIIAAHIKRKYGSAGEQP